MKGEVEVRYSELINFNPIESVIELKKADDLNKAKELVKTYVMSDEMADKLDYGLISQVQLEEVVDNKGVLIVGNYGTGKSHLMSVISAVANNQDLLQDLNNKKFQEYMEPIAGKFEVLRIELGAVDNNLRDIIMKEIEEDLADRGIDYKFPDSSTLTNNKVALAEMMSIFETKYSNSGYLIVVDELLDYLKMRKEQEIMIDLMFLKEAGEFIKNSRFRLICGVQEQLFDNPTFSFVADTMSKIKDRFEQVIIRKEDTAYVVSERILNKTSEQKAKIREHLLPFCPLYTEMSERLEDYVELFPIHPAYIDIFNRVNIAENRHVLKTISTTIKHMLDEKVPSNAPGIISFDSYPVFWCMGLYCRSCSFSHSDCIQPYRIRRKLYLSTHSVGVEKVVQKIVPAQVKSAIPLTKDQVAKLEERLSQITGRNIKTEIIVEPALIGGLTVRIGDIVYDGSIAKQLGLLKEHLQHDTVGKIGVRQ